MAKKEQQEDKEVKKVTETKLQDIDTEEAILGLMMIKGDVVDVIMEKLSEDDFTQAENRMVFIAIREMFVKGQTSFNEITIEQVLQEKGQSQSIGGKLRLLNLQSKAPYPLPNKDEVQSYIGILKEKTLRRQMYEAAVELQQAANAPEISPLDGINATEKVLMQLGNASEERKIDTETTMQNAFEFILNMYNGKPPEGSIKTGIGSVDQLVNHMAPTDFVLIGARPSMGKTVFATNIMENVALEQNRFVALYSLEMSAEQIGARMIMSQSGISAEQIRRGKLNEEELITLEDTRDRLQKAPFVIDDRIPLDITSIISRSRKLKAEKDLGLIIIDYVQLMTGNRGSDGRQQEISDISRSLKLLAKELNVPVIALSQLNRSLEQRNDKRPQMSDLRESGSLEQDADIVIFLYRDDYYNKDSEEKNITEAIVAKHRNGPIGTAKMYFSKDTTRFYDLSLDEAERMAQKKPPERQKKLFDGEEQQAGGEKQPAEEKKQPVQEEKQRTEKNETVEAPLSEPPSVPETDGPPTVGEPPTFGENPIYGGDESDDEAPTFNSETMEVTF